jgi:WD40 repeat protein
VSHTPTSPDNTVRIWDPATGQQRSTLTGHTDTVTTLAIAPDSTWLATTSPDNTVRIWDPATGAAIAMMRTDQRFLACAWHPSQKSLTLLGPGGLYSYTFTA